MSTSIFDRPVPLPPVLLEQVRAALEESMRDGVSVRLTVMHGRYRTFLAPRRVVRIQAEKRRGTRVRLSDGMDVRMEHILEVRGEGVG